jgi:hypothetical protein
MPTRKVTDAVRHELRYSAIWQSVTFGSVTLVFRLGWRGKKWQQWPGLRIEGAALRIDRPSTIASLHA